MEWYQLDETAKTFSAENATHRALVRQDGGAAHWSCCCWRKEENPPHRWIAGYDSKEDAMHNAEWQMRIIHPWKSEGQHT